MHVLANISRSFILL